MQVSASAVAQKVTLSEKNVLLVNVFNDIRLQTGYDFLFTSTTLNNAKLVNIKVKNEELKDVLNQLFDDQPFTYAIDNNTIIVKQKEASFLDKVARTIGLPGSFSGTVIDSLQTPIIGANVSLIGAATYQTTTDVKGQFKFPAVPLGTYNLVISYIGYQKLEKKIDLNSLDLKLAFVLHAGSDKLDEVLITGYSTTTARLSTGAIGKVSGAQIEQQPVSDPILAMEGRVPGLFITQSAGNPGAPLNVEIRGQNSLSQSPPLYIIDGIPFSSTPVEQTVGGYSQNGFSPLNTINPSDIESIDVLKDADATAIYGSRGANGVIVITTKKGKMGNTKFNVDLSDGFGEASHLVPMATTAQYLSVRRQAFANDGITPNAINAPDLFNYSQTADFNYPNLLLGNTSHQSNAAFSVSGGDAYTQFLFGGNLRHESTIYDANTADNAEQFHLNLQHKSHDNKFGLTANVSYNVDNNSIPNYNLNSSNYGLPPNYPLYNSNGSLFFGTGYTNPLAAFNSDVNLKSNNLITSATMRYTILPGLDITADAGYNLDNVNGTTIDPASSYNPANNFAPLSILNNNYVKTYIVEPKITYTYLLGKGKFTFLAGGTWQETQNVQPFWLLSIYTDPQLATSLNNLTVLAKQSGYTDYRYDSGYGRLEYESAAMVRRALAKTGGLAHLAAGLQPGFLQRIILLRTI